MTRATLGILTSGGDCSGLNAVIRAATDAAAQRGWNVLGLRHGHLGRLASTAASHSRIMLLEAMGRDSGFLALYGGVAGGADVILIPEFAYDLDAVAAHIKRITHDRPGPVLVVVAEGIARHDHDRRRR